MDNRSSFGNQVGECLHPILRPMIRFVAPTAIIVMFVNLIGFLVYS